MHGSLDPGLPLLRLEWQRARNNGVYSVRTRFQQAVKAVARTFLLLRRIEPETFGHTLLDGLIPLLSVVDDLGM